MQMQINCVLSILKLWFLNLIVFHHCFLGIENSPSAEEVEKIIRGVIHCHVHLNYDNLDLNGPFFNSLLTIWKEAALDMKLRKGVDSQFRKYHVTRIKRMICVNSIFILAEAKCSTISETPTSKSLDIMILIYNYE
jgi:hypothetical protein